MSNAPKTAQGMTFRIGIAMGAATEYALTTAGIENLLQMNPCTILFALSPTVSQGRLYDCDFSH
jgi:hypothetical protein